MVHRKHLTGLAGWSLLFLLNAVGPAAAADGERFRVCAFSFNSADEIAALSSHLPASRFEIIDMSPPRLLGADAVPVRSTVAQDAAGPPAWLMQNCRADVQCDVVVYSGEFAGRFFGKYGASLGLQDLEEASCQRRCAGLFQSPQEVFLLACNTLASKDQDSRTPAEYLQVLLDHDFDRASAERVVNLRYGPLGPSFREALRRTFMSVPRIYGFSSIAPRGEWSASRLSSYFHSKGDYGKFLAKAAQDRSPNKDLLTNFRDTSLVQISGLTEQDPASVDRRLVCALYDETRSLADRLHIVRRILARNDMLSFLPTIQVFFARHPPTRYSAYENSLFSMIQNQSAAREQLTQVVSSLNISALQMELAHLGFQLGWIKRAEFRDLAIKGARQLLREPLSSEVVDIMCEITKHENVGDAFRSADLPQALFEDAVGLRLVDCLAPQDDAVNQRLVAGLDSDDELMRLWASYALSKRLPLDDKILKQIDAHRDDPSADLRWRIDLLLKNQEQVAASRTAANR